MKETIVIRGESEFVALEKDTQNGVVYDQPVAVP